MKRRHFLRNSSMLLAGASLSSIALRGMAGQGAHFDYPPTRIEPVEKSIGGVTWTDNYAWLRRETEEVIAWQQAQHDFAGELLREGPEYDYVYRHLDPAGGDSGRTMAPVRNRGGKWFVLEKHESGHRLSVSESPDGDARRLLDPKRLQSWLGEAASAHISGFEPSPNGQILGFAIDAGTGREGTWYFVDVECEVLLNQSYTGDLMFERPEWFSDSSGFYRPAAEPRTGGISSNRTLSTAPPPAKPAGP